MGQTPTQTSTQTPNTESRELASKLRDAASMLEEFDERFAKWVNTFDVIYNVLIGSRADVQLDVAVYPSEVEVRRIVLPAYEISTYNESAVNRYMNLGELNYDNIRRIINSRLSDIIAEFIRDLKEYAEVMESKAINGGCDE